MNGDERFEWDDGNEGHVVRHGVEPFEVEEALLDPQRVGASAYSVSREKRSAAIGATVSGRILYVVYTSRGGKFRAVTVRDADDTQKRRYRKRR